MPGDIFGLRTNSSKLYDRQVEKTWPESANYGYLAGGEDPGVFNTIYRIDFSNETVLAPEKNLPLGKSSLTAVSNSNYGYFAGGYSTPPLVYRCTIDRLDFSNETVAVPPVDNQLTKARSSLAAVSNSNYGYFGGGFFTPPSTRYSIIDRIDFSSETVSAPPGLAGSELTEGKNVLTAVSSSNYGYFAGGYFPPSRISTIDRIDFSNETVVGPPIHEANLTQARSNLAAVSSSDYGYFGGGGDPSVVNTIDRIDFSSETVSLPGPSLPSVRRQLTAVSNLKYGYFCGGSTGAFTVNIIDRIDFSSETVAAPGNDLTAVRKSLAGVSGRQTRIRQTTDISGNPIAKSYGYYAGGNTPSTVSTVRRIEFSNETVASPGNDLTQARRRVAVSFNNNYGYFAGGGPPSYMSTIDRLDFSNETMTGPPVHGLNLSEGREGAAGVLNSNYGYFGGGEGPPYLVIVDRLDFSNETISPLGNGLTQARRRLAAVSNYNYGYFGGGSVPSPSTVNTIDRIDFSTETIALPPVENKLQQSRHNVTAVSASDYGYFAGGGASASGAPYVDTIDKIDFSNETTSAAANNLTQGRGGLAGSYNSNYGYFAGGFAPPYVTTIDKIDFSNEATSAAANNLPQGVANFAAGVSN